MKLASLVSILLAIILLNSCKNISTSKEPEKRIDSLPEQPKASVPESLPVSQTHLKDTITLNGSFILFLLPDSARFASLEDESGIYDADSDFGVGIANTTDSVSKNQLYKNIRLHTTEKRYINIKDCSECPIIIDRDTVNYGVILSSNGKKLSKEFGQVHSADYTQTIKDYFHL